MEGGTKAGVVGAYAAVKIEVCMAEAEVPGDLQVQPRRDGDQQRLKERKGQGREREARPTRVRDQWRVRREVIPRRRSTLDCGHSSHPPQPRRPDQVLLPRLAQALCRPLFPRLKLAAGEAEDKGMGGAAFRPR